jgi:hypothetical protein
MRDEDERMRPVSATALGLASAEAFKAYTAPNPRGAPDRRVSFATTQTIGVRVT